MCSQSLRISQGGCEFGKVANLAMWFANLAMWFANLAMRNFAKLLKFYVRQMNSVLALRNWHCEIGIAKLALRNSQGLPTGCQQIAN